MNFRRVVIVDMASLGIGAARDATKYDSTDADTLGHLDAQYLLDVPTFQQLGLGNIQRSRPLLTIPSISQPHGFYGRLKVMSRSNARDASLREMFDFNQPLRTLSLFNHLARCRYNTVIISRFISYLANQDCCTQIQEADDNTAFKTLVAQLQQMDTGLLYLQVPELPTAAEQKDVQGYAARLAIVDKQVELLMSKLTSTDLLVLTSSFANDPTIHRCQITREYLPLLLYTPGIEVGGSLGTHPAGDVAITLIDNFGLASSKLSKRHNLLTKLKARF